MTPSLVRLVRRHSFDAALKVVSEQDRAVAEICDHIFEDESYINQLPRDDDSGYVKVGSNDHVIIWMDDSGDAIWFDQAGALSSFGVVCVREGVLPEDAISNYHQRINDGDLYHKHNNLYYWP
jgi:hypothetical protein